MAAKLPLTVRKGIRDEFESKKGSLLEKTKDLTGEDYEFTVDFQALYPTVNQADDYQTGSIGSIVFKTYESFVEYLGYMERDGGKTATEFFNKVVSSKKINVLVEALDSGYHTIRIVDGVLELVYRTDNFGTNTSNIAQDLQKALDKSFTETNPGELPLTPQLGFEKDFLEKKEKLESQIAEELNDNKVTLVADPAEVWKFVTDEYAKLKKRDQGDIDLDSVTRNMGAAIFKYFDGFRYFVNYKFKQDEMMVEAFLEQCEKKEVAFKLVAKSDLSPGRSYNDAIFEDGRYVIRTSPQTWYSNADYATEDIEKLL